MKDSPSHILLNFHQKLSKNSKESNRIISVLVNTFNCSDQPNLIYKYWANLITKPSQVIKIIEEISPGKTDLLLPEIRELDKNISKVDFSGNPSNLLKHFNVKVVDRLRLCSAEIEEKHSFKVIDSIDDALIKLNDLIEDINSSDLESNIKSHIVHLLSVVKVDLININITGSEIIKVDIETVTGATIINLKSINEPTFTNIMSYLSYLVNVLALFDSYHGGILSSIPTKLLGN